MTRIGDQIDPESMDALASPRCANVSGFSLHANVSVPAGDRPRLERLVRYCARPPIAMERLEPLADGRLLYRFKRPWHDGTTHVVFFVTAGGNQAEWVNNPDLSKVDEIGFVDLMPQRSRRRHCRDIGVHAAVPTQIAQVRAAL